MKMTITEVSVHPEDENPVFGRDTTRVRLDDEGGGAFVKLIQENEIGDMNVVRLDFKELETIVKAIRLLEAEVADD